MRDGRECKMQNFISFLMVLIIFLRVRFIIYERCPFKGQLSLAGYAESSIPEKLRTNYSICEISYVEFRGWNSDEISSYLYNIKNSLYLKNPISIRFRWDKCSRTDFFRHTFHRIRNHFQNFLSTRFRQISFWKFFFKIFMEYPYQPSPRWETTLDQWGRLVGGLLVGRRYKGLNFLIIIRVCQSVFWSLITVFFR